MLHGVQEASDLAAFNCAWKYRLLPSKKLTERFACLLLGLAAFLGLRKDPTSLVTSCATKNGLGRIAIFSVFLIPNLPSARRTDRLPQLQAECSNWDAERLCEETPDF